MPELTSDFAQAQGGVDLAVVVQGEVARVREEHRSRTVFCFLLQRADDHVVEREEEDQRPDEQRDQAPPRTLWATRFGRRDLASVRRLLLAAPAVVWVMSESPFQQSLERRR